MMTQTRADLAPKHAAVLAHLIELNSHKAGIKFVAAGSEDGSYPFATLRAMERRGLVRLSWRSQDGIHGSTKPYRVAYLTDEGRATYEATQPATEAPVEAADEPTAEADSTDVNREAECPQGASGHADGALLDEGSTKAELLDRIDLLESQRSIVLRGALDALARGSQVIDAGLVVAALADMPYERSR